MKKENQLKDGLSGFLSRKETVNLNPDIGKTVTIEEQEKEELNKLLEAHRKKRSGRKKKGYNNIEGFAVRDSRFTVIVNKEIIKKIRFISLKETRNIKDIVGEALQAVIAEYEKTNGIININNNDKKMKVLLDSAFFTVREIAKQLDVTTVSIRRYISAGKLKAQKIGKDYFVNESDYLDYLKTIFEPEMANRLVEQIKKQH